MIIGIILSFPPLMEIPSPADWVFSIRTFLLTFASDSGILGMPSGELRSGTRKNKIITFYDFELPPRVSEGTSHLIELKMKTATHL